MGDHDISEMGRGKSSLCSGMATEYRQYGYQLYLYFECAVRAKYENRWQACWSTPHSQRFPRMCTSEKREVWCHRQQSTTTKLYQLGLRSFAGAHPAVIFEHSPLSQWWRKAPSETSSTPAALTEMAWERIVLHVRNGISKEAIWKE